MNDTVKLFDNWASSYDESVRMSDRNNTYPFAGYATIQKLIYKSIIKRKNIKILEMGIGTGKMTYSLYNEGYKITGVDSSIKMIDQAMEIMPKNRYINKEFKASLEDLKEERFDVIIFAYSIHHISLENQENLLLNLLKNLNHNGEIIIGDVMTKTNDQMSYLSKMNKDIWDDEEYYPTLEHYSMKNLTSHFKLEL